MKVKTRKAKHYTSILLQEMSEQAFKEAMGVYNSLEGTAIIKPSNKDWESFLKLHSLTLDKVRPGEEYKILGTTFKVVRALDYNRKGDTYPIVRYFDRCNNEHKEFGIIGTDNFAAAVHETCFKNCTGTLLYF